MRRRTLVISAVAVVIAHRGVHQTSHRRNLENDTCTTQRIYPPVQGYIENALPSMWAAFAVCADIVELDVHPTTDGRPAVLHGWTLKCSTNGAGVTRKRDMAYLKSLDVGYGYTAIAGAAFPCAEKASA